MADRLTAEICNRGDFIDGFAQGTITYLANHMTHRLESEDSPQNSKNDKSKNVYSLSFNGKVLKVFYNNVEVYSTSATSGKGEYMNNPKAQNVKKGPIQEGSYYFKNSQWKSQSIIRQIYNIVRGNGDWGDYNVPLTPVGTRSGFYLHGGFFEGSGGCIDAGGNIDVIYDLLKSQKTTYLKVDY